MAIKKSELYSSLWQSCDELRGGMDASQYKDYVLVLLFIKYVSDKYAGQPFAPIIIPEGASFKDMVALKGKSDAERMQDLIDTYGAKPSADFGNSSVSFAIAQKSDTEITGTLTSSVFGSVPIPLRLKTPTVVGAAVASRSEQPAYSKR